MEKTLRVGVITSTHGLRGEVKVFPTTDDVKRFDCLKNVIVDMKRGPVELEVAGVKYFKKFVILKFKGYDDINDIQQFVKKDLLVTRENAVKLEEGEYFICDLVGCRIINEDGGELGVLKDILQTAANDVYIVERPDGKELLIPSIPQCILERNVQEGYIKVHLLKGLLDL